MWVRVAWRGAALRHADIMLLLVAVVWGTSYGVAKEALAFYPVVGFLAVRFLLTFVLLLPALRRHLRQALAPGLPLGAVLLAIFLCETYGVAMTSASNAAFLISLCVMFTPFIEWIFFKRRPETVAFVAGGVSFLGAMMLTGAGNIDMNLGDCLMIAAAVLRGFMMCLTKKLVENSNVPTLALTAIQAGVVGFGSLAALLFVAGGVPELPRELSFWMGTFYLVVFGTLFAFFAQNYAVRRTTPSRASLLMGSEPLFGALFATVWLSEKLSVVSWIGGLLIVGASLWATRPRRSLSVRPATTLP